MLRKIVYSWTTSGLWEIFSNGSVKASLNCPIGVDLNKMTIKAAYDPEYHEIVISAEELVVTKKTVSFDIEDATPQRPHSTSRQKSTGGGEQSEQPDGRTQ